VFAAATDAKLPERYGQAYRHYFMENITFDSIGNFILKYFTQILFIPVLLGGIIQIFNLFSISPQFIRFFSATQAIADGLLILLVLVYTFAFALIAFICIRYYVRWKFKKRKKENNTVNNQVKNSYFNKNSWILHILTVIGIIIYYYFYLLVITKKLSKIPSADNLLFFSSFLAFCLNFIFADAVIKLIYKSEDFNIYLKKLVTYVSVLTIISSIFIITIISKGKSIATNFTNIERKYHFFRCDKGYSRIIYYNDKYIFIESYCVGYGTKITIEKFEVLFDSNFLKANP